MSLLDNKKRIVLKISGESLKGQHSYGFDPQVLRFYAQEIAQAVGCGLQIGIVVGGGNFLRGSQVSGNGLSRLTADHAGMLATIMNALIFRDFLEAEGLNTALYSSMAVEGICGGFDHRLAKESYKDAVVLFAGGTGNPLVSTDTCAALRAIETEADLLVKITPVGGLFEEDPKINPQAKLIPSITFEEVLQKSYKIMDLAAFYLCKEHRMPLAVTHLHSPGSLISFFQDKPRGTFIQ